MWAVVPATTSPLASAALTRSSPTWRWLSRGIAHAITTTRVVIGRHGPVLPIKLSIGLSIKPFPRIHDSRGERYGFPLPPRQEDGGACTLVRLGCNLFKVNYIQPKMGYLSSLSQCVHFSSINHHCDTYHFWQQTFFCIHSELHG